MISILPPPPPAPNQAPSPPVPKDPAPAPITAIFPAVIDPSPLAPPAVVVPPPPPLEAVRPPPPPPPSSYHPTVTPLENEQIKRERYIQVAHYHMQNTKWCAYQKSLNKRLHSILLLLLLHQLQQHRLRSLIEWLCDHHHHHCSDRSEKTFQYLYGKMGLH